MPPVSKPRWSQENVATLYALAGSMTVPAIARRLGRSPQAIYQKMYQLDMRPRQGRIPVRTAAALFGCECDVMRKYRDLSRRRATHNNHSKYHLDPAELSDIARVMLDEGTIRSVPLAKLREIIRDYGGSP